MLRHGIRSASSVARVAIALPITHYALTVDWAPPAVSNTRRRLWPCTVPCWRHPTAADARVGYLVSVRGTQLHVPRLDDIAADLRVEATCITRSENNVLYQFSVSAAGRLLLDGRAAVVLDAGTITSTSEDTP